ncbi:hypothetical protein AS026_33970 [Rhizobium altiplani]|uniref:Uncharacterized protein n=1 Tax=Rhizobium altiplani TaxID=1864509 RepID=A0A109JX00_9HYPH|nr:hypothetical protein AS026_33970 [Rhizobium altiplani]
MQIVAERTAKIEDCLPTLAESSGRGGLIGLRERPGWFLLVRIGIECEACLSFRFLVGATGTRNRGF